MTDTPADSQTDPTDDALPETAAATDIAEFQIDEIHVFLAARTPFASLPAEERAHLAPLMRRLDSRGGGAIYKAGDPLEGLFLIAEGSVEVRDNNDALVSILGPGNSFGERGLMRDGVAVTNAQAEMDTRLFVLPAAEFQRLRRTYGHFERFFDRSRPAESRPTDLTTTPIAELMTPDPLTCRAHQPIQQVARMMRDAGVSCVFVVDDAGLQGIVTTRDLTNRALAEGLSAAEPVGVVMTPRPIALSPDALGGDVLYEMLERRVGHLPVVADGALVGVVTQTDLTRRQAVSSATLIREIFAAADVAELARLVGRIPELLTQLVGAGHRHDVTTRLITDVADATTRRLIAMAEARLGPPPVPYLWLACGSQGRREQTGVSDQDNCLFLSDALAPEHEAYFEALAKSVTHGLADCGYYLCPGDMMATNPRWRRPVRDWRGYFERWIDKPDPTAQMLASVMFDLRPIAGDETLYADVIGDVLEKAAANSIFVAHMIGNAVGHAPPLGLFGGVATIRSGERKETIDLKHNGVAPVVDLARIYALQGRLTPVNTRARLQAAAAARIVSASGGHDLIDAYDLIAESRLRHQAARAKAGEPLDNFMAPSTLSDLERSHLRDAFVVVRTMQSALSHGRASIM